MEEVEVPALLVRARFVQKMTEMGLENLNDILTSLRVPTPV